MRIKEIGYMVIVVVVVIGFVFFLSNYSSENKRLPRESYDLSTAIFSPLPPIPEDFVWIDKQVEMGRITQERLNNLTENYWKQPEFYPNFETSGLSFYKHKFKGRRNCFGYGAYPRKMGTFVDRDELEAGDEIYAKTFFHTGFGIECWQGTKLIPYMSENAEPYFEIIVEPKQFLLKPNYPEFREDWVREIRYIVKVKYKPPEDTYTFGFNVKAPDREQNEEWRWQYKNEYVTAGKFSSSAKIYQFVIDVEEGKI